KVMPDDHSEVVPLLPIPNRTVKRLCADDSADSRVKVGHRQAVIARRPVYGRGVLISAPETSIDENAKSVLEFKASLMKQPPCGGNQRKPLEVDRSSQNLS